MPTVETNSTPSFDQDAWSLKTVIIAAAPWVFAAAVALLALM